MFLHVCVLFYSVFHLTSKNPGSLFIEIKKVIFSNTIDTTPHAHCTVVWFSTNIRHCWTSSSHDKYTRHRWKQTTLFLSAILGGSLGGSLDDMRVCSNECKNIWNIKITVIEKTTVRNSWSVYPTTKVLACVQVSKWFKHVWILIGHLIHTIRHLLRHSRFKSKLRWDKFWHI